MTEKIKIIGSEFCDNNLTTDVCTHLSPILSYLVQCGLTYDDTENLFTDKGGAKTKFVKGEINFEVCSKSLTL